MIIAAIIDANNNELFKCFTFIAWMVGISRSCDVVPFISEVMFAVSEWKHNMLNYSENMNATSTDQADNKFQVRRELFSLFYAVGIIGSILALLHLNQKQNFKNPKQAFMLR